MIFTALPLRSLMRLCGFVLRSA